MKLEKIFENDDFILYQDNKGYDFMYDIECKKDEEITLEYGDYEETIEISKWVGLFPNEKYIVDCIIEGNYTIKKIERKF